MTDKPQAVEFDRWAIASGGKLWLKPDGEPVTTPQRYWIADGDEWVRVHVKVEVIDDGE